MEQEDRAANSAKGSDQVTLGHPQNPIMVLNISGNMENVILWFKVNIPLYERGKL